MTLSLARSRRRARASRGRCWRSWAWRGGGGFGRRVQAALELAEDDAEQEVAPGGLDEGAAVAAEGGQVGAGGVEAVGEGDERPAGEVLGDGEDGAAEGRREWEGGGDVA